MHNTYTHYYTQEVYIICLYFIATKQIGTSKNVILGKGKDIKIWTCSLFWYVQYVTTLYYPLMLEFHSTKSTILKIDMISPNNDNVKNVL